MNYRDISNGSASAQNTHELLRKGSREAHKRNPSKTQFYTDERLGPHRKGLRPTSLELNRELESGDLYIRQQDDPLLRIESEHDLERQGNRVHTIVSVEREPLRGGFRCDGTGHGDHDGVRADIESAVGAMSAGGRFVATIHVSMLGVSIQMLVLGEQIPTTHPLWGPER